MNKSINIRSDERVLVVGKTGSGKTYASRLLLAKYPRVLYLDSLHRLDMEVSSKQQAEELMNGESFQICVDDNDTFTELVDAQFSNGDFVIYIDEVYGICPPQKAIPEIINRIWTRGRGNGIGAWAATQRPTWLPIFLLSEAEHYLVFRLQVEDDRKKIAKIVGESAMKMPKNEHGFTYYCPSKDVEIYLKEI